MSSSKSTAPIASGSSNKEPTEDKTISSNDVKRGLDQIRQRLLDLTARNKLLNFRHGATSLRFVDIDPEASFQSLVSEQKLVLQAVNSPTLEEQYLLGNRPLAKHVAESRGWRTDFELAPNVENTDQLRALFFPDDLDAIVRKIGSAARTAIEESGTNLLHLVFGFLEWRESEDSTQVRHAPLVAVPVKIHMPKTGSVDRNIRLEFTGEDLTSNISLLEKMRRDFGLDLPRHEMDETPNQYFVRFSTVLERKRDWRILKQMSLCLLSFGKLLMYLDLDSARWPNPSMLESHELLGDLFNTRPAGELSIASEYQIDDEERMGGVPLLVCDADSSQHSALIDAERGRSLVIEGPPGTGKSQTITNLIASYLARGKRVLFVAEKMAALDVVKRRMDSYGLGHFCLELHSHKTNKVGLLRSLEERLQSAPGFTRPSNLTHKRALLTQKVQELSQYSRLLNEACGALSLTPFELIWSREHLKSSLPEGQQTTDGITFLNTHTWTVESLEDRKTAISTYVAHLRRLQEAGGSMRQVENPWHWLPCTELSLDERETLLSLMRQLRSLRESQVQLFKNIKDNTSPDLQEVPLHWLGDAGSWQAEIPGIISLDCESLIAHVMNPTAFAAIESFARNIEQYQEILALLPGGGTLVEEKFSSVLSSLLSGLEERGFDHFSFAHLEEFVATASIIGGRLTSTQRVFDELSMAFSVQAALTVETTTDLLSAMRVLEEAPQDLLDTRHQDLLKPGLKATIRAAVLESRTISSLGGRLAAAFNFDVLPSESELETAADTIDGSSWFSRMFSGNFKRARAMHARILRSHIKTDASEMSSSFRELALFLRKKREFSERTDLKLLLPSQFRGIDTGWSDLSLLVDWYERVQIALPDHRPFANELRQALLNLPATRLKGIVAGFAATETLADLRSVSSRLQRIKTLLPHSPALHGNLSPFLKDLEQTAAVCRQLLAHSACLALGPQTTGKTLHEQIFEASRARQFLLLVEQDQACIQILGDLYQSTSTDVSILRESLRFAHVIRQSQLPLDLKEWLVGAVYLRRRQMLISWIGVHANCERALQETEKKINDVVKGKVRLNALSTIEDAEKSVRVLDRALAATALLPIWLDTKAAGDRLDSLGLGRLRSLVSDGAVENTQLEDLFSFQFYDSMIRRVFNENPDLWKFTGVDREEARKQFAKLDIELIQMNRADIAYRCGLKDVPSGVRGRTVEETSQLALIQHEIRKQKRHRPIRDLMNRAGEAIQALKPCFMMSPMSVAQFMSPGQLNFDLVVMDEASQMRPEDALGAIARGSQVVIVGDPKQLPPTSFFQRALDDENGDEEQTLVEESESILDIAQNCYQPVRRLRWHYRSAHHSLIAFSNREFYDGTLVVFPSAYHSNEDLGVKYVAVQGIFENRRNPLEAERVVDAVLEHIANRPKETLGVVTMNFEQRELIEELLDQRLRSDTLSKTWIEARENTPEPFFVKNLENVQGDERDVIFISVTYGPDSRGNLFQRFAGVNTKSGHRRLNVLISRARKRTVTFSSIDSDLIQVTTATPWGVRALKGYLQFAKTGVLDGSTIHEGGEPDNEHEAAIGNLLKSHGYDVVPQVGVSGYFIDLGIRHPRKPGSFILGVEFDGKSYHSGRSARDRDRLRQMTLENQGWQIHRIWSTDWFKNQESEVKRLLTKLQTLESHSY